MAKYYTVYFDYRKIVLLTDFRNHFVNHNGLFVKCSRTGDLAKILVFFQTSRLTELYIISDNLEETFGEFTKGFEVIEAAGGVVRNTEGLILMIKRNGVWDLPKGKIDPGEQPQQTALREVEEECGIAPLQLGSLITITYHTYSLGGKAILKPTYWYNMQYFGAEKPTPQQEEGITDVVWVNQSNLNHYTCNSYGSILEVLDKVS